MGFDRGGWYSYDQLDMGGSSAVRILPEYQAIEVGDVIPTSPTTGFVVRAVEPRRALVLYSDTAHRRRSQAATASDDQDSRDPCRPAWRRRAPSWAGPRKTSRPAGPSSSSRSTAAGPA